MTGQRGYLKQQCRRIHVPTYVQAHRYLGKQRYCFWWMGAMQVMQTGTLTYAALLVRSTPYLPNKAYEPLPSCTGHFRLKKQRALQIMADSR